MLNSSLTRRDLLAIGEVAAATAPAILRGADLTKDAVRLGPIGVGTRGWDLIKFTGAIPEAKVVAVCAVDTPHLERFAAESDDALEMRAAQLLKRSLQTHR